MVESIMAPALPKLDRIGKCMCGGLAGPRIGGHLIVRNWGELSVCAPLFNLCGSSSLSQRTYPNVSVIADSVRTQTTRLLRAAGMEQEEAKEAALRYFEYFTHPMQKWMDSLPPMLMQNNIRTALRSIHNAGYLFVKIDRSPGRVMLMCRHAWLFLQQSAFLQSPRYTLLESAETDENYMERVCESLKSVLRGSKLPLRKMKGTGRPYGYWTVKNKSLLFSVPPLVK